MAGKTARSDEVIECKEERTLVQDGKHVKLLLSVCLFV